MEKKFALIGKTLKHSHSKKIHKAFGDYSYDLVELDDSQLQSFVKSGEYAGYNVTIPYKKDVMQYLDKLDYGAKEIGAVNTVVNEKGLLVGYNTDFYGMKYALESSGIVIKDKTVMILGSGGTCNTACAVAKNLGAKKIEIVSRSGALNYQNCYEQVNTQIIINTTPVGTYPDNYNSPIDLARFANLEGVLDVVYNPLKTKLTFMAEGLKIKNANGLSMLVAQAKYASELFTGNKICNEKIETVVKNLEKELKNIILIGMPGSGKSTVGKIIAQKLNKEFIDTDLEIEKRVGVDIPTIFERYGEDYFRNLESQVLKDVCALNGKVIATGGGIVKRQENLFYIKQNGIVVYLKRDLEKLDRGGRPLSKDLSTVKELFNQRKSLYQKFSDFTVDNDREIQKTCEGVFNLL